MKETILDPIRRFMNSSQRDIYDDARQFLAEQEANFSYLPGDDAEKLRELVSDPEIYQGNRIQKAKTLLDTLKAQVEVQVTHEREAAVQRVQQYQTRLENADEFEALTEAEQEALCRPFEALIQEIRRMRLIAVMRDHLHRFESRRYPTLLHNLTEWASRDEEDSGMGDGDKSSVDEGQVEFVTRASLSVNFDKPYLVDEDDVDRYVDAVRKTLVEAIKNGKRIYI
jgi:hypothetical protein